MAPEKDPAENKKQAPNNKESSQQPKTLGRHDEAAKSDIPVFQPLGNRKPLKVFVIIAIVLLLVLAGLFGWLWWQERYGDSEEETATPSSSQQEPEEEAAECPADFTLYTNGSLGIEFCHPTIWGDVAENDAKFEEADTGSRWRLSFADKSSVNLGLVSDDWDTNVSRDSTCVDPAVQTLPPFSPFSTEWEVETTVDTEPPQPSSAVRGIEVEDGSYLIQERVDDLLNNGACLSGYAVIDNETYPAAAASYFAEFNDEVTTPQQHMDNPDVLIPTADREDFATFAKSIKASEE